MACLRAICPCSVLTSTWSAVHRSPLTLPLYVGLGPRACLGRKFSHTEALCFLALILRDWKLDIPLTPGETRREYEERVMGRAGRVGMAFGCGPVALKMTRRN
jgi:hypothetical protein